MANDLIEVAYDLAPPRYDERADLALRLALNRCVEDGSVLKLFRPMPDKLRTILTQRAIELRRALDDDSPNLKAAYVADMLGSYDPRRRVTPETESELRKWLADLAGIPTWAVCRACAMVKAGHDGVSDVYRPTTIQVLKLCREVMSGASTEAARIERVFNAKPDGPQLSDDERAALGTKVKTFAAEFARGDHRGTPSSLDAMAAQRRAEVTADLAASDDAAKLREYEALGIEPIKWGDGRIISVALLRTLGRLPKVGKDRAKKAKSKAA
jgi:hypothetical protein